MTSTPVLATIVVGGVSTMLRYLPYKLPDEVLTVSYKLSANCFVEVIGTVDYWYCSRFALPKM